MIRRRRFAAELLPPVLVVQRGDDLIAQAERILIEAIVSQRFVDVPFGSRDVPFVKVPSGSFVFDAGEVVAIDRREFVAVFLVAAFVLGAREIPFGGRLRVVNDAGGDEHDQFGASRGVLFVLEQIADDRQRAQTGDTRLSLVRLLFDQTADDDR
ncbi:MAG: hypothetical protein FD138_1533 [Planctomycetota bacterium]|nr:MAG: hypothetical protein FD138_1533 [Planctomycetota bacterium]